ncbi:Txe/YoeB family addiction module toxin [Burkholderia gladioli]|uniref:Txe/YoeB family addiction module toxin n=1 Tax=Burkholderia gladioli TaxID=28095 RepID=UPI003B98308C
MTQKKKAKNKAEVASNCKVAWSDHAWDDYLYWQKHRPEMVDEINRLIEEISRDPFEGTGKPEPLRGDLTGFWSRRITKEDRLVYIVMEGVIHVVMCRFHYK